MESFGERLKREREKRGVSLEDVSAATKISTRMLRALEEGKFDQLPGGIFNKGFVRAYAQQLGMDEEQAVADYLAAVGQNASPPDLQEPFPLEVHEPRQAGEQTAARIPWGALAILLLLAALGFAVWNFYSNRSSPASASQPVSLAQQPRVPAEKTSVPRPQSASSSTAARPAVAVPEPAPGAFTVLIKADEDSWLSIQADGKQVVQETLTAAAQKSISAQREIVVRAGNIGALELFFNGNRLPSQGDYGEVKTLTFDPSGLHTEN